MNNLIKIGQYEYDDIISFEPRKESIFRPFYVFFFPFYDQQNLMLGMSNLYIPNSMSLSADMLIPPQYRQAQGKVVLLQLKQEMEYDARPSISGVNFDEGKYLQDYPTGSETAIITPKIQVTNFQNYVISEPTFTDSLLFNEDFIKYLTSN